MTTGTMASRICKHGHEYRGRVCHTCHPRGSGARGQGAGSRTATQTTAVSKLTWHFQFLGTPVDAIAAASGAKYIKVMDPPATNPFPGKQVIGRTYIDDNVSNAIVAKGAAGAEEWFARFLPIYLSRSYVTWWEAANEPQDIYNPAFRQALTDYSLRLTELMHGIGRKVVTLNLSVGAPDILDILDFKSLAGRVDAIGLHEYSAPTMQSGEGWYCLRYRKYRAAWGAAGYTWPATIITETGIDGGVLKPPRPRTGWKSYASREAYFAQLQWYDAELAKDPEILAATVFTSNPDGVWTDFDFDRDLSQRLAAHIGAGVPPEVPPMTGYPVEVVDGQGGVHDLAWLQANYGALIAVHQVPAPCYRLKRIIIKETGDVNLDVWVHNKDGQPEMGTPCTYSFPAAGADDPLVRSSADLPTIPAAFLSRWAETGVLNKNATGGDGHVSFQIGSQSWISSASGGGPYAVWVLSNRLPSDCVNRIGWRVLTNHFGPTTFLFEEVTADVVVPPSGDLPENEPVMAIGLLADKVRWWMEESVRQDEAGNTARAKAIRYSLIKLNVGLLYRLENALKAGKPQG
jgi:hypothetical protein